MKILLTLLALTLSVQAFAQQPANGIDAQYNADAISGAPGRGNTVRTFDNRYQGIKGTPYLSNLWERGIVKYSDGKKAQGIFKINLFENSLMALLPAGDSVILFPQNINEIRIDQAEGEALIIRRFPINTLKNPEGTYAVVVYDGNSKLIYSKRKNLLKADYKGGYSADRRQDEFIDSDSYYIQPANAQPVKLKKLTAKNILSVLPKHTEPLKAYIAEHKLNLQREDDIVKLLTYYDSLP